MQIKEIDLEPPQGGRINMFRKCSEYEYKGECIFT